MPHRLVVQRVRHDDLLVALPLGALAGFQLLSVTPSSAPITEQPLALIPTVTVPLFSPCT